MEKAKYLEIAKSNDIHDDEQALGAINFALDLLEAERAHLEITRPGAYSDISRLESARSELDSLLDKLKDYMV